MGEGVVLGAQFARRIDQKHVGITGRGGGKEAIDGTQRQQPLEASLVAAPDQQRLALVVLGEEGAGLDWLNQPFERQRHRLVPAHWLGAWGRLPAAAAAAWAGHSVRLLEEHRTVGYFSPGTARLSPRRASPRPARSATILMARKAASQGDPIRLLFRPASAQPSASVKGLKSVSRSK